MIDLKKGIEEMYWTRREYPNHRMAWPLRRECPTGEAIDGQRVNQCVLIVF